jgi:hypothetical protein
MHNLRLAAIAVFVLVATGCSDKQAPEAIAPQATTSGGASNGAQVELASDLTSKEAFPLATGSSLSGSFTSPRAGSISIVSVTIGNYANTADGELGARLCQQDRCETGKVDVNGSADNSYLAIALQNPLKVVVGTPVSYTITRTQGTMPLAIWTYAPSANLAQMKINDAPPVLRTPNLAVRFVK